MELTIGVLIGIIIGVTLATIHNFIRINQVYIKLSALEASTHNLIPISPNNAPIPEGQLEKMFTDAGLIPTRQFEESESKRIKFKQESLNGNNRI